MLSISTDQFDVSLSLPPSLLDEYNLMETRHLMGIESSIEELEELEEDRFNEDEGITSK